MSCRTEVTITKTVTLAVQVIKPDYRLTACQTNPTIR